MVRTQLRRAGKDQEKGYILITLVCFTALLAISFAAVLPSMIFELKRDREEECIHRGVQYTRAIRQYAKKYGRYPNKIEDLENTSGVRFLRRRYKDPITGKDFKVLHMADVQLTFGAGSTAILQAHQNPGPQANTPANNNQTGDNPSNANVQNGALGAANNPSGTTSLFGDAGNQNSDTAGAGQAPSDQNTPAPGGSGTSPPGNTNPNASNSPNVNSSNSPNGQVFGGGGIVGVVSTSKNHTIREFKKKNHYDQWQFYYDPSTDRGLPPNAPSLPLQPPPGSSGIAPQGQNPTPGNTAPNLPPQPQQGQPQQEQQQ